MNIIQLLMRGGTVPKMYCSPFKMVLADTSLNAYLISPKLKFTGLIAFHDRFVFFDRLEMHDFANHTIHLH